MELIHIIVFIIATIAMLIYGFRKQIKAWIIRKVMAWASKKMMESMTGSLVDVFDEVKKK